MRRQRVLLHRLDVLLFHGGGGRMFFSAWAAAFDANRHAPKTILAPPPISTTSAAPKQRQRPDFSFDGFMDALDAAHCSGQPKT